MSNDSFYSLKTNTLAGKPADLSQYAGKVTLVVNVASACGFTPQYALGPLTVMVSPEIPALNTGTSTVLSV